MDILNSLSQALYPGHRVIRVKGFQGAKDYPMPRDSEAIMLDEDPATNFIYMKKIDADYAEMNKAILDVYATGMGKIEAMKKLYWTE